MPKYATNKKARHDYNILDTLEAGLILAGHEVKAIRGGQVKLTGAYVTFHKDTPMLTGAHISRYKHAGSLENYDPDRSRSLLLHKRQIDYIKGKSGEKGLTIVPLSLYTKGRHIKLEIGIARGKKVHDKRRSIKKRELDREMRRKMKEH